MEKGTALRPGVQVQLRDLGEWNRAHNNMPLLQVDMKIMYYELIKMLIDYERKNHPESYDATKTVGKIEGYQVQDI